MPLPEDEASWAQLDVMFATTSGTVRRNKLSDFVDVRPSGIIAMKLENGESIVDVQICTEKDDVLLTANGGQCIRFPFMRCACSRVAPRAGCAALRLPKRIM
jgi:Type IIA topoisomerase (DNA gyrase/topo II, topoisomerase IV), A subunit